VDDLAEKHVLAEATAPTALDPKLSLSAWIVLALVAFGRSVVLCIYVLLPKDGLIFAVDASEAYEALYQVRDDDDEIDRRLAYWLQSFREGNHPTVQRLTKAFELAGFALLAEIGFLACMEPRSAQPVNAAPSGGAKPPPPPPPLRLVSESQRLAGEANRLASKSGRRQGSKALRQARIPSTARL
jgi:hypothetical protein